MPSPPPIFDYCICDLLISPHFDQAFICWVCVQTPIACARSLPHTQTYIMDCGVCVCLCVYVELKLKGLSALSKAVKALFSSSA